MDFCRGWGMSGKGKKHGGHRHYGHGSGGTIYLLGFIGAAIYYIQTATGFWDGVLGVLKAIVWPAFLIFKLLGM